jgi:hypothetical protein
MSLTDNPSSVNYNCNMFIIQATANPTIVKVGCASQTLLVGTTTLSIITLSITALIIITMKT